MLVHAARRWLALDLKCYCFNVDGRRGYASSERSLTALTCLDLWGCTKVMDKGMRAVRSVTGLTSNYK